MTSRATTSSDWLERKWRETRKCHGNLTLREIAIWISKKNCQKSDIFFIFSKNCIFSPKNDNIWKKWKTCHVFDNFWHLNGNFPEGQMATQWEANPCVSQEQTCSEGAAYLADQDCQIEPNPKSVRSTPKCYKYVSFPYQISLKSNLKKSRICSIWGQ